MSCRSTSGGSASTSLARIHSGLSDRDIVQLFHALKREGDHLPAPTTYEFQAWMSRQEDLLDRARRISDSQRDNLRERLFRARSEPTPDGGMFYAWSRVEARARQEVAIRSIPEAIDLEPAGSQRHLYELDAEGKPAKVWYASYGSNLHRDRFLTYIKGGQPEGSTRWYAGCADKTEPEADIAIRVAGARPHFALTSRVWHGGIAFIDAAKGETATGLGRAYGVSRSQFEDVVAQENGFRAGQCSPIPYDEVLTTGRVVTGDGPYETLLHIGDHDGAPVLTFTAPFSTRDALGREGSVTRTNTRMPVRTNKPSPAYLRMIGSGLKETFDMDEVAQADYLRGCPGGDRYTRKEVVQILRTPNPAPEPTSTSKYYGGRSGEGSSDANRTRYSSGSGTWADKGYVSPYGSQAASSGSVGALGAAESGSGSDRVVLFNDINGTPVYRDETQVEYLARIKAPAPASARDEYEGSGASEFFTQYEARLAALNAVSAGTKSGTKSGSRSAPTATGKSGVAANTSAAVVGDVDPKMRAIYPGVKDYPSVQDQEVGVRGWKKVLNEEKRALKFAAEHCGFQRARYTPDPEGLARAEQRLEHRQAVVAELTAKVKYAKVQEPGVFYRPNPDFPRRRVGWEFEETLVRSELGRTEREIAYESKYLSDQQVAATPGEGVQGTALTGAALKNRRIAQRRLRAAENIASQLRLRLVEVETMLAGLPEEPDRPKWAPRS